MKLRAKLVRNGNALYVCIPKPILAFNQWDGQTTVIVELALDHRVIIREPTMADNHVPGPTVMLDRSLPEPVTP